MVFPSGVIGGSYLPNSSLGGNGSFLGISSGSAASTRRDRTPVGTIVAPTTVPDVQRNCLRDSMLMVFSFRWRHSFWGSHQTRPCYTPRRIGGGARCVGHAAAL